MPGRSESCVKWIELPPPGRRLRIEKDLDLEVKITDTAGRDRRKASNEKNRAVDGGGLRLAEEDGTRSQTADASTQMAAALKAHEAPGQRIVGQPTEAGIDD